ncbi:Uncharacterised protein [Mycobacteroides abscessus subsp. abscessus]|nr:Uncharacterised protein [Mycobacteroides abscessus subsp. abscessus]SKV85791.1 Uncharacterised protein [Mycobacteroides abscessus subsp. abscessus]SKW23603.1 Uncharacterised protein [Mycobacteroides abscessus subsp. abscessus]
MGWADNIVRFVICITVGISSVGATDDLSRVSKDRLYLI